MALGITVQRDMIKRFGKDDNTIYVKETDSAFTPLTGSVKVTVSWVRFVTCAPAGGVCEAMAGGV